MNGLIAKFKKKIEEFKEIEKQEEDERKRQEEIRLKEEQERLKKAQEEEQRRRTLQKDSFKLYLDQNNRTHIYYKDNELTKGYGLNTGIFSEGNWYGSVDSQIKIQRPSSDEMILYLAHNQLPLIQTWHLQLKSDGILNWEVEMQVKEPLRIDLRNASLFLSKAYKEWLSPPLEGQFPSSFDSGWQRMNPSKDNPEFIGARSSLEEIPSIVFKDSQDTKALLMIQNTDLNLSCRVLEIQCEGEKEFYQPGTYSYLKAVIQLYPEKAVLEDILKGIQEQERKRQEEIKRQEEERLRRVQEEIKRQEEERRKQEEDERKRQEEIRLKEEQERLKKAQEEEQRRRTLQKDSFKLYLDQNNRTHIYYKDNELTKGHGLNTGIFSEGNWYGLSDSKVEIEKPSPEEMTIHFLHNQLPLTQIWHLRFKPDGILIWDVNMHLKEPLRIDRRNASLFLSKAYKEWLSPPLEGQFPSSFDSGWQRMNPSKDNPEFIGARSSLEEIPSIVFKDSQDTKALLMIQNTDLNLSSRVLEIQFEGEKEFYQPGTYSYLKAVIQLYPEKAVLEDILKGIQKQERKRQEEIKRQEEERRKQEEVQRVYIKLKEDIEPLSLSKDRKNKENTVYIFGDCKELHDKIVFQPGNFQESISKIRTFPKDNLSIKIGVSRFNFFKLDEIVQFCSILMNHRLDLRSISLPPFPLKSIYYNFSNYIKELEARIGSDKIRFFLQDNKLPEFLWSVSSQADQHNEKDLLRLLGIITEHPFIGPQTIVLDTYHRCNTNCIHCWIHTPKRKLSSKFLNLKMDLSLYKGIIDDAAELLTDEIIIQGDGEPLLDSRFIDMVHYARDRGLKVLFFTNAILLDKNKAQKIIDLEIDEIFCSLPAGTDKTYAVINPRQPKGTFNKIVKNLNNLISMRNEMKKNKPWLQMTHVIHNLNYHELNDMAKIDAYIGADKVRFYLARLDKNIVFLKLKPRHIEIIKKSLRNVKTYLEKNNIELQDNIYFQLKNYNSANGYWSENKFLKTGCPVGWFFCLILAKGEVSMCCHLRIVDYLKEKSFKEAWNSELYNRFRIQAKYLMKNKDVTFLNDVKLYDEFCNHCDTHQVILGINKLLQKYSLTHFL